MFKSWLLWRMAARNVLAQKFQTALTLLGGSVGVMLAVAAVVFWTSFDESGMRWLRAHFGVIDWELRPAGGDAAFTAEQTEQLARRMQGEFSVYPAVTHQTVVRHDAAGKAASNLLIVGIDPASPLLPEDGSLIEADDRVIVSVPAAERLGIREGDMVAIAGADGTERLFKVSLVAEERGLTGYRGAVRAAGTLIMNPDAARDVAGLGETEYNTVFASKGNHIALESPDFLMYFPDIPYTIVEIKKDAVGKIVTLRNQFGTTFMIASLLAVAAGIVLMHELFLMLAGQRRVRLAALRALGFTRRDAGRVYWTEAAVLNVGSVILGTLLGLALGPGLLYLFRSLYLSSMQRFAALEVPILPHVSLPHVLAAAGALLAANALVALRAAWSVSRLPIAATLRGLAAASAGGAERRRAVWRGRLGQICAAAVLVIFFYLTVSGEAIRLLNTQSVGNILSEVLVVAALWLASPFALLYLFARWLEPVSKAAAKALALLRVPRLPVLLALRWPLQNRRRVLSVSVLFAIVGLMITSVMTIGGLFAADLEKQAKNARIMGYSAYIPYADETEKAKLLETLDGTGFPVRALEPYRINISAPGVFDEMFAVSVYAPDEGFIADTGVKLTARAPGFATDAEVWEELKRNPDAVVLHKLFSYSREEWGENTWAHDILPSEPIRPGDSFEIAIYPKRDFYFFDNPEWTATWEAETQRRTVTVLGFVDVDHSIEFYHLFMTSPQFYEAYRDRGFQWPNTPYLGYLMIRLDTADLDAVQRLEDALLLAGIRGLSIPGLEQEGRATLMKHTLSIYVAFMVAAAIIGLAGLAIIQMRAIREREAQLGMMRSIGVGKGHLAALFLIEGSLFASVGLAVGWAFGTLGGYGMHRLSVASSNPLREPIVFEYPALPLAAVIVAILLAAVALNVAPALRSLAVSPGTAVRTQD